MTTNSVEELFIEILEQPAENRASALANANYSDEVKETVRKLLEAYESSSPLFNKDLVSDLQKISPGFLDTQPISPSDTVNLEGSLGDIALKRGQKIGNYVVKGVIGSGGMSVVYRAKQSEPIERDVAIKLIRPGNSTDIALKRFFREQQAVAILRHPNIASLHEVTRTKSGKPVAVMELIRGRSITEFCDHHQLNWKHRVGIMLKVCRGLSHAHQRGVVHRDIKPENILVAVEERKPVPKLIDFGIAAITRTDLGSNPTLTQTGQWIGTPRYMSPEQFKDNRNLDHRTDIYSAAMVLFELLAGVPFLEGSTAGELMNKGNDEPELLSARIRKVAVEKDESFFGTESPDALAKFASKDLDWILAKALAHNPEDRYEDVASFASDLRAAMQGTAVSVSAPSRAARARKFLARHARPIWVGASLAVILFLSFGIFQSWNSEIDLQEARLEKTRQVEKTAAANDLIMTLLASDEYQLTSDEFDLDLVPAYRAYYQQIQKKCGPKSKEDKFIYGILAVMEAMIGDFDQAETLMETADAEHGTKELRAVRNKICEKYAEAAKVRLCELDTESKSFEKASQQMTLARCYFVWGMYDDGQQLLVEAIEYFESHRPGCYESLVARLTLIKILERSGKAQEMKTQLVETLQRFRDQHEVLSTERGKITWSAINRLAQKGIAKH